ncbi:uncharacterized protein L969DRAFT_87176 [Mixia osmundae IAM 14324]|uniref:uncharacterized protein n=1 Tax=Mixia osmundae (strain CBS 9802 / IAM 14324 / JCM 22182 / KY 12970) TaxID=764103 RepID=UPI0004A54F9D|nr:uncharacterized protein L969DRAFT_87176 [Mixia osmundae IAM 14324]KEI39230.1 hypothetical protein L969DRAFT_87176 [Mixia osmundae IAM 14324]
MTCNDESSSTLRKHSAADVRLGKPVVNTATLTVRYDELPPWQQDNPAITAGYRSENNSYRACFYSICGYLHNETANIWTHLLSSTSFIVLAVVIALGGYINPSADQSKGRLGLAALWNVVDPWPADNATLPTVSYADTIAFYAFKICCALCLGFSWFFHTVACHSDAVAKRYNKLDYVGIVLQIYGSNIAGLRFAYFCDVQHGLMWAAVITVLSAGAVYTVISPTYRTPAYRRLRTMIFAALGLSAIFPVGHAVALYGVCSTSLWKALALMLAAVEPCA